MYPSHNKITIFFHFFFTIIYIYIFFPQRNKIAGTLFLVRSLFFGNILCGQGFVGQIYIYIYIYTHYKDKDRTISQAPSCLMLRTLFFFFGSVIIRPSFFCLYLSQYSQALFFLKSPRGGGGSGVYRSDWYHWRIKRTGGDSINADRKIHLVWFLKKKGIETDRVGWTS